MNQEMEMTCFQLISNSCGFKSSYVEAIRLAKRGKYDEVEQKLEEAREFFIVHITSIIKAYREIIRELW